VKIALCWLNVFLCVCALICVSLFKSWFGDKLQLEFRVNDEEMNLCVKAPLLILR